MKSRFDKTQHPEVIKLPSDKIDPLLGRIKARNLTEDDYAIFEALIATVFFLSNAVHESKLQLKKVLRQIFGIKSEKSDKVFNLKKNDKSPVHGDSNSNHHSNNNNISEASKSKSTASLNENNEPPIGEPLITAPVANQEAGLDQKGKGHGRNGADAYTGAKHIWVHHATLKPGDPCPECPSGKLYPVTPGVFVYIEGQPHIQSTVYDLEKLRCNPCGAIFTAGIPIMLPESNAANKSKHYDETAKTILSLLKYGNGFPMKRQADFLINLGIPLAASTQWDKIEEAADKIHPAFEELKRQAAQGSLVHHDDSTIKIIEVMKQIEKEKEEGGSKDIRTGIFTTGIVSVVGENRHIALFFSGRKHAGENMDELMKKRASGLPIPKTMSDAKKGMAPKSVEVIEINCNTHGRRPFVYETENYPAETEFVLGIFSEVYKNDKIAREQKMTPDERLKFHQEKSGSPMAELFSWLNRQIDEKRVEPNSSFGKAIMYLLNHWPKLTQFLKITGAPLDNNICERALKMMIRHRKNSLFFKTLHGAYIGDMFMSLIHTCRLAGVNAFEYLTELQKHSSEVFRKPAEWMPWNYHERLAGDTG